MAGEKNMASEVDDGSSASFFDLHGVEIICPQVCSCVFQLSPLDFVFVAVTGSAIRHSKAACA
jgi:hypothetical protein